jgi:hypothetical protein
MEPCGCNQWQSVANRVGAKAAETSEKPLPCLATSCRDERMVRRGSAVRVRQRALQKRRKWGAFCFGWTSTIASMEPFMEPSGSERTVKGRKWAHFG